jgi:hypothetical protein
MHISLIFFSQTAELPRPGGPDTFDMNPTLDDLLPPATRTRLSGLSQSIWEPPTSSKYNSMHDKWLYFCQKFERSSSNPTQADINAYVAWLGTAGSWASKRDGEGDPMRFESVRKYVEYVGRALRELHKAEKVVTDSMQTHWALQATKRLLGDTKQRARPITLAELRTACENIQGPEGLILAFRVIALTAWFGAMRLGQLLPTSAHQTAGTMLLSDLDFSEDGQAVLVSSSRSKTNVFRAKLRKVAISACDVDPRLCLKTALAQLLSFRRARGLPTNVPLSLLHAGVATFEKFVGLLQGLIPGKSATKFEKGHVTGHSFRRGFTKAALLAGFSIEQIMLHGDWSHPDSVTSSYAAGAVLPSIPMARHVGPLLTGSAAFVSPPIFNSEAHVATKPMDVQQPRGAIRLELTFGNPFTPTGSTTGLDMVKLARNARQWEFDNRRWSSHNPFKPCTATAADTDNALLVWLDKRAREWELQNNPELIDDDNKRIRST